MMLLQLDSSCLLIPCGYPAVGSKLCKSWVLSCQHQLQILARGGADGSEYGDVVHPHLILLKEKGDYSC